MRIVEKQDSKIEVLESKVNRKTYLAVSQNYNTWEEIAEQMIDDDYYL